MPEHKGDFYKTIWLFYDIEKTHFSPENNHTTCIMEVWADDIILHETQVFLFCKQTILEHRGNNLLIVIDMKAKFVFKQKYMYISAWSKIYEPVIFWNVSYTVSVSHQKRMLKSIFLKYNSVQNIFLVWTNYSDINAIFVQTYTQEIWDRDKLNSTPVYLLHRYFPVISSHGCYQIIGITAPCYQTISSFQAQQK